MNIPINGSSPIIDSDIEGIVREANKIAFTISAKSFERVNNLDDVYRYIFLMERLADYCALKLQIIYNSENFYRYILSVLSDYNSDGFIHYKYGREERKEYEILNSLFEGLGHNLVKTIVNDEYESVVYSGLDNYNERIVVHNDREAQKDYDYLVEESRGFAQEDY